MPTRTKTQFDQILERLEKQQSPISPEDLDEVSQAIAAPFHLKIDEVAVLEIVQPGDFFRFLLPQKLRSVGTIPVKSNTAFVSRTARLRRAEIVNNFEQFRHSSVFEGVPLGRAQNETIQKIVSAPILNANQLLGAVQLCRKGTSSMDSGPDFNARDLAELKSMSAQLARFLALCRG